MTMRHFASSGAVLGSLVLCGCSLVAKPEPACRVLMAPELPLLGGILGVWMDEERFVLADLHMDRLLVYDTSNRRVRVVDGWEVADPELRFQAPHAIVPWGDGFLLGVHGRDSRVLELDADLQPVGLLWESDGERVDGRWVQSKEFANVNELLALNDRLYTEARRYDGSDSSYSHAEFGSSRSGMLELRTEWPLPAGERRYVGQRLATTKGTPFVLRYVETPFIQLLEGEDERLAAFPKMPAPLPELPPVRGFAEVPAYSAALEAASWPAALYGDEHGLYVLTRDATGEKVVWDLHSIDPERDEITGTLRLPTNATYVSLLPGSKHWLLEESSSVSVDFLRAPIRLLLLSSDAMRAGKVPPCDFGESPPPRPGPS